MGYVATIWFIVCFIQFLTLAFLGAWLLVCWMDGGGCRRLLERLKRRVA